MFFRTYYDDGSYVHPGLICEDISLTQQHFAAECDINNIVARYAETGYLSDPLLGSERQPQFGDFSTMGDYLESQSIIAEANQYFDALPSSIRNRFQNNPALLLQFMEMEENRDEAISMGLVNARVRVSPDMGDDTSLESGSQPLAKPVKQKKDPAPSGSEQSPA
ncbi:MAG: internal scaffolding protein [Microvirus sp.]|nr:MAG: internal scaffolding protein [Microvirus sp.]